MQLNNTSGSGLRRKSRINGYAMTINTRSYFIRNITRYIARYIDTHLLTMFVFLILLVSLPCSAEYSVAATASSESGKTIAVTLQSANSPAILVMGDSLSAGYGISKSQSWVALLTQRLASENLPHSVINASISGETTSGGLSRLKQAINQYQPHTIIIELGANDGLRGLPLRLVRQNLERMIRISQETGTQVLLLGMRLPPNYGPRYTQDFAQLFVDLSNEFKTGLVPFFLVDVAIKRDLMQSDGLHPTAAAQPRLLDTVWDKLLPLLEK